ncbi:hypothetical protein KKB99_03075 [bacterium]|nr:hypothetical protein [bacterium]MBU1024972.1 hypothetical protein [bacterium]
MPIREKSQERNFALDLIRVLALALMVATHVLRNFISDSPGSWGNVARFIGESSPVFFFIAFGMTLVHTTSRTGKWRSVLELGIVALFHQVSPEFGLKFYPDFFFFLWQMLFLTSLFNFLFLNRWFRIALASAIIFLNLFLLHEHIPILGAHPFGLMPWSFFVIVGMMFGINPIPKSWRLRTFLVGLGLILLGFAINKYGMRFNILYLRSEISKWEPTTSPYLLIWTGIAIWTYLLFHHIKYNSNASFSQIVMNSSRMLLCGAIIHLPITKYATNVLAFSGYNIGNPIPPYMAVLLVVSLCAAVYVIQLTLADLKIITLLQLKSENQFYKFGWIILIILACITWYLFLTNPQNLIIYNLQTLGMILAAFIFVRTPPQQPT